MPVQTVVARIETEAGAVAAASPAAAPARRQPRPRQPPRRSGGERGAAARKRICRKPRVRRAAPALARRRTADPRRPAATASSFEERLRTKSSPLVRKIAAEHGIEIAGLQGTGIAGRVTKTRHPAGHRVRRARQPPRRARRAVDARARRASTHARPDARAMARRRRRADVQDARAHQRAHGRSRGARRRTSRRSSRSTSRASRASARRRAPSSRSRPGEKLTYLPFIITGRRRRAQAVPDRSTRRVAGTDIIYRKQYNIGIAVALDWGLIVPVIKHADDLSLAGLTRRSTISPNRARAKKLRPEEVQDATFTITNPGVFGSLMGTPIIPVRTSAILGSARSRSGRRSSPGADGEDTIAIRTCAYFSLSFDHRVIDGAVADQFLAHVKQTLETVRRSRRSDDAARAHDRSIEGRRATSATPTSRAAQRDSTRLKAAACNFWVFEEPGAPGAVHRVHRSARRRRRSSRGARRRVRARDSGAQILTEVELPDHADTTDHADGKEWRVFPSGYVTQYEHDEFGLMFIAGTGAES